MLLSIKVFTDLLDAKIVQKLTGVIYFQFPIWRLFWRANAERRLNKDIYRLYQYRSVANGGTPITFYCS